MSRPKYLVFSIAELEQFATLESRNYLVQLQTFLHEQRVRTREEKYTREVAQEAQTAQSFNRSPKPISRPNLHEPLFFVLKLSDPFALAALEHYVARAADSSEYGKDNGLKATVAYAIELKNRAVSFSETKIPD